MDKIEANDNRDVRDDRAPWERPVLRRLAANKAEGSGMQVDDGNCHGTGSVNLHTCQS